MVGRVIKEKVTVKEVKAHLVLTLTLVRRVLLKVPVTTVNK
jgi:hypothetical protein